MLLLPLEDTICHSPSSGHYDPHPSQMQTTLTPSLKNSRVSLRNGFMSKSRILSCKSGQGENEALWVLILGFGSSSIVPVCLKTPV